MEQDPRHLIESNLADRPSLGRLISWLKEMNKHEGLPPDRKKKKEKCTPTLKFLLVCLCFFPCAFLWMEKKPQPFQRKGKKEDKEKENQPAFFADVATGMFFFFSAFPLIKERS